MVILTLSQSHSGGVIVKPYTGNIAQKLQLLSGENRKNPFLDWVAHGNPVITTSNYPSDALLSEMADMNDGNTCVTGAALGHSCLSLFCLQVILITYK